MKIRSLRDHKQHKIASIISDDLNTIIPKLENILVELNKYAHYTPVKKITSEITMNLLALKSHQNKYSKLVEETKPK